ncbi:MAG: aminotransferase class IV [Flavobacteriaceae bacterium]
MINHNGELKSSNTPLFTAQNRGFLYGDAVFETLRYGQNQLHFWEDHYFRLMATMRIFRMAIPMEFTPEFLAAECLRVISAQVSPSPSWRLRLTVYRADGGAYLPTSADVGYIIEAKPLANEHYNASADYKVDLFKDYYIQQGMLSNLKSTNKALNVIGSVFMKEQGFDNGILVNDSKEVVEFLNGNLFVFDDQGLRTPPLSSGCLDGVMRKQILRLAKKLGIHCVEETISPFDLQKVEEIFVSNSVLGIQAVSQYRRTVFQNTKSMKLLHALNDWVSSSQGG